MLDLLFLVYFVKNLLFQLYICLFFFLICSCYGHMNIYKYIYINLPVNTIVRLPYPPWGEDSQCKETFLAPSADNQTNNYDTECSNHHPSLSSLESTFEHRQPGPGNVFNSADNQTCNYDTQCSNHHSSRSTLKHLSQRDCIYIQSWFRVEITLSSIFSVSCTNKSDRIYGKLLGSYIYVMKLNFEDNF